MPSPRRIARRGQAFTRSTWSISGSAEDRSCLTPEQQLRHRAEDQEANRDSGADDDEEEEKNSDNEEPVAPPGQGCSEPVVLDDLVIARVRFEPERERVADYWDNADKFVDQNVERHSREKKFRDAQANRL